MLELLGLFKGLLVVVVASTSAMWINDRFHLGGEFKDDAN
jgi:hypothetical protein